MKWESWADKLRSLLSEAEQPERSEQREQSE